MTEDELRLQRETDLRRAQQLADAAQEKSRLEHAEKHRQTDYVVHDADGAIVLVGNMPNFMLVDQPLEEGHTIAEGKGRWDTHHVVAGEIKGRQPNPATASGLRLSDVPNPSDVTIDGGNPQRVTDGVVDLSFTLPGTYEVRVHSWPYLDAVFKVTQP